MKIKFSIKKLLYFCIVFFCLYFLSNIIVSNIIYNQEINREKKDIDELNKIKDIFQETLDDEQVFEYMNKLLDGQEEVYIYLDNGYSYSFVNDDKWYPSIGKILKGKYISNINKFESQIFRKYNTGIYIKINQDYDIKVMLLNNNNKMILKSMYLDELFEV